MSSEAASSAPAGDKQNVTEGSDEDTAPYDDDDDDGGGDGDGLLVVPDDGEASSSPSSSSSTFALGTVHTLASLAGNVFESYDFTLFGFFADVIGDVFFPPSEGNTETTLSFVVFGAAFFVRPFGGAALGYIGDVYGRKVALTLSIFLMAVPTFLLGCLPGYDSIGHWAWVLLLMVRLLQGFSVSGQLMASVVYTVENHDQSRRGLYGSFVFASASVGSVLGSLIGTILRESLSYDQLSSFGWRIPFWTGIIVAVPGYYLYTSEEEEYYLNKEARAMEEDWVALADTKPDIELSDEEKERLQAQESDNPLVKAFSRKNWRPLLACALVPAVGFAAYYLTFVWMVVFMEELIETPVPHAAAINTVSLFLSNCLLVMVGGYLSDYYGRKSLMTVGAVILAALGVPLIHVISSGDPWAAFFSQCALGVGLSLYSGPMPAWLVESFPPGLRMTSASVGYNVASAIVGGTTPAIATYMVDAAGESSPGYILTSLAVISLLGLWWVAPFHSLWT